MLIEQDWTTLILDILQFIKNYKMSKCLKFMVTYLIFLVQMLQCAKSPILYLIKYEKKHLQKSDTLAKYEKKSVLP